MQYTNILTEIQNKVGIITINRPKALNALNSETITELTKAVDDFGSDSAVRVIVITGSGDKAFIAGADITGFLKLDKPGALAFADHGQRLMKTIEETPKPVIAAVNGYALGGGTELALACDFVYASDNAVFGLPEVSLGIFPGFGGTQRLNKVVGMNVAREMIYTGKKLKADEAYRVGLVNKVVAQASLMDEVMKVAASIIANSPHAIGIAKEVINQGATLPLDEGLNIEKNRFGDCFGTPEMIEGVSAFIEKRKPNFE